MWILIIALVIFLALLGKRKTASESKTTEADAPTKPATPGWKPGPMWIAPYVDGNLGADTGSSVAVALRDTGISLAWDGATQHANVPFGKMDRVVTKSEEDIHRDVTLGRLLVFGVLAFGMKKKQVTRRSYTVIRGKDANGKAIYAMLDVDARWQLGRASEKINEARQKYRDEHPSEIEELADEQVAIENSSVDPLNQISKLKSLLNEGAITQEEFDTKKSDLLKRL